MSIVHTGLLHKNLKVREVCYQRLRDVIPRQNVTDVAVQAHIPDAEAHCPEKLLKALRKMLLSY